MINEKREQYFWKHGNQYSASCHLASSHRDVILKDKMLDRLIKQLAIFKHMLQTCAKLLPLPFLLCHLGLNSAKCGKVYITTEDWKNQLRITRR